LVTLTYSVHRLHPAERSVKNVVHYTHDNLCTIQQPVYYAIVHALAICPCTIRLSVHYRTVGTVLNHSALQDLRWITQIVGALEHRL